MKKTSFEISLIAVICIVMCFIVTISNTIKTDNNNKYLFESTNDVHNKAVTITLDNQLEGSTEYYISSSSSELKDGKWEKAKSNKITVDRNGISYVFYRIENNGNYKYINEPKVVNINKDLIKEKEGIKDDYILYFSDDNFKETNIKASLWDKIYNLINYTIDDIKEVGINKESSIGGPSINLTGKTISVIKDAACDVDYYQVADKSLLWGNIDGKTIEVSTKEDKDIYVRAICKNGYASKKSNKLNIKANDKEEGPLLSVSNSNFTTDDVNVSIASNNTITSDNYEYYISTSNISLIGGSWISGKSVTINKSGIWYVYFKGTNKVLSKPAIVKIDKLKGTSPITKVVVTKDGNVNVVIRKKAEALSDIKEYEYYVSNKNNSLEGGSWTKMNSGYSSFKKDGNYYVYVRGVSNTGIKTDVSKVSSVVTITDEEIKTKSPSITGGTDKYVNGDIKISINKEASGKEVSNYEYYLSTSDKKLENGSWTKMDKSFKVSIDGTKYAYVRAKFKDNTYSDISNVEKIMIDKTKPTTPTITGGGTSTSSLTVKVSKDSVATSGISKYQYYVSTKENEQTGSSWKDGKEVKISSKGIYYVFFKSISNVGLTSPISKGEKVVINNVTTTVVVPTGTISIKDYSSYSANNTDWSNAIMKAEKDAKASKKNLYFPAGTYEIRNYLTKTSGVNWYGDNRKSILYVGDNFVYNSSLSQYRYVMQNENMWSGNAESAYDTFTIDGITFESNLTTAKYGVPSYNWYEYDIKNWKHPEGWCKFTSTNNVIINNVGIVNKNRNSLPFRGIDFFGANINTTIKNSYAEYNSVNDRWGSFTFRNFSDRRTKGILIENNTLIRNAGLDEPGWICANKGDIEDIIVRGNTYKNYNTSSGLSGVIDIQQGDFSVDYSKNSHNVRNVLVENNYIYAVSLMHNAIRVGNYITDNSGKYVFSPIDKVIIRNNTLDVVGTSNSYPAYGIVVQDISYAEITGNTITGRPKTYIYGDGVAIASGNILKETSNKTTVANIGVHYCKQAHDNNINISGTALTGNASQWNNTVTKK